MQLSLFCFAEIGAEQPHQQALANRRLQHGHSQSCPWIRAEPPPPLPTGFGLIGMRAQPEMPSAPRSDTPPRALRFRQFAQVESTEVSAATCGAVMLAGSYQIVSPSDAVWFDLSV
jgi:hypothetical protein